MKTIFRILVILVVSVLVSGAVYLTVENTSLLSDGGASEISERPEMPAVDMSELPERPEGDDHNAASMTRGLSEIGVSLAKLTGITIVVLLVQGMFAWLKKRLHTHPAPV